MQLSIEQSELETAVRQYVEGQGIARAIETIDFSATRGDRGIITTIDFADQGAAKAPVMTGKFSDATVKLAEEDSEEESEPANDESDEADDDTATEGGGAQSIFGGSA